MAEWFAIIADTGLSTRARETSEATTAKFRFVTKYARRKLITEPPQYDATTTMTRPRLAGGDRANLLKRAYGAVAFAARR